MRAYIAVLALLAVAMARETHHSIHRFTPKDWVLVGDAAIHDSFVRLAPDRQSKKGALWNLNPVNYDNWEVIYEARIHGVSLLGADGMAFWYAAEPGVPGDLYGSKELFHGFSLIVDTYDNDKTGVHPYVFGMFNDGTYKFDHAAHDHKDHTAGAKQRDASQLLGELNGCTVRMRNLKAPTAFKITYINRELKVLYSLQPGAAWTQCFSVDRISLPRGYYFGWSAATGDLADDHDVGNITIIDPRDSVDSIPAEPSADDAFDKTARQLQAKMDGLLEVVGETLKTAGRQTADFNSLGTAVRSIQGQTSALSSIQNTVNEVADLAKKGKMGGASGSSWGFFSWVLFLGLGGSCAYLAWALNKERRSKKLF